jgi:hypothetical protein
MTTKTLENYTHAYKNTEECNGNIIIDFTLGTNSIPWLKAHRDFIENAMRPGFIYGHGDRSLQYMWKLIVDSMSEEFSFLEIGVYKGQILSLIQLCANESNKKTKIVGVTPLLDPSFAKYNRMPYIENLYKQFSLTMENTVIIDGRSQEKEIIEKAYGEGPYNIVYIDGDHAYDATVADIRNYHDCLTSGGLMVIDDASNFKIFPNYVQHFKGIMEVSEAVRDVLENNIDYEEILTCMHVRVFRKK